MYIDRLCQTKSIVDISSNGQDYQFVQVEISPIYAHTPNSYLRVW
jgi:hypothetical protein